LNPKKIGKELRPIDIEPLGRVVKKGFKKSLKTIPF
jgi:hypothetical protein